MTKRKTNQSRVLKWRKLPAIKLRIVQNVIYQCDDNVINGIQVENIFEVSLCVSYTINR